MSTSPGSLAHFIGFCRRHQTLLAVFLMGGLLGSLLFAFLLPAKYTARAVLLPQPQESGGLLSVAASLAGSSLPLAGLAGMTQSELQINEAVLHSERLADLIHAEFHLDQRYHTSSRLDRLEAWNRHLHTSTTRQGLLEIRVRDKNPGEAAAIVARLLEHLDQFNRKTRTIRFGRVREFIEVRLVEVRQRLRELEDTLVDYQKQHTSLVLSPTNEAVVTAGAELLSERIRLETEVRLLQETLSGTAPMVREKRARMEALDAELSRLPQLGTDLGRILREIRVVERTYGYLTAQLEDARLEEARNTPTVDILDPPVIPVKRTWPQRTLLVLLGVGGSWLLGLLVAKFWDAFRASGDLREAPGV